jgi:hypothetical protein
LYKSPIVVEISPLISYAGEGLEKHAHGTAFQPPVALFAPQESLPSGNSKTFPTLSVHVIKNQD